ncbi:hypothetical protein HK099_003182 [Clydaea vesicula]|uniref:Rieske domain-containing protein n=1 Tax=Clydaea vesicula TaxID=447962 RepID=A0AAD5U3L8_9FUNG|nr:hypothetical protein HK099_003182 [Clydaea vesicula]
MINKGDAVVLYRDPLTNDPIALADKCAHRSVPLSAGKIMDGRLECLYHGWQYDAEGKCIHIPTILPEKKIPANAKVRKYSTFEVDNWIWIHPGTPEQVEKSPLPKFKFGWNEVKKDQLTGYLDLDIDHSLLCENFLDPAHINFTHTSTFGNRDNATAMNVLCKFYNDRIESFNSTPLKELPVKAIATFYPPSCVTLRFQDSANPNTRNDLNFYSIPTTKGNSRFIWIQRAKFHPPILEYIPGFNWFFDFTTRRFIKKVILEDYVMLKGQQEILAFGASAMNSPVSADLMIKVYRNWWRKAMKKKPWFSGYGDIEDIILD